MFWLGAAEALKPVCRLVVDSGTCANTPLRTRLYLDECTVVLSSVRGKKVCKQLKLITGINSSFQGR